MCKHAKFCGKRMADGDRENGCSGDDGARCNPVMGSSPTAPPAPDVQRPMWLKVFDGDGKR